MAFIALKAAKQNYRKETAWAHGMLKRAAAWTEK
jgi:hypothetical protein